MARRTPPIEDSKEENKSPAISVKDRPSVNSDDVEIPSAHEVDLSSGKPLDDDTIYTVTGESMDDERIKKLMKEESEMRNFMEQTVTFEIQSSGDENEVNPVSCGVNGEHRRFYRGQKYTEKRKFLDSLIKVSRKVKTVNFKDENGIDQTKVEIIPKLVYPIQIWHDPAGDLGTRWFRHQQANG